MKTYRHWMNLIDSPNYKDDLKELFAYIEKYPASVITFYYKENSLRNSTVICLECNQNYSDLDMDVNSGSSNLRRYERKPGGLHISSMQAAEWRKKIFD